MTKKRPIENDSILLDENTTKIFSSQISEEMYIVKKLVENLSTGNFNIDDFLNKINSLSKEEIKSLFIFIKEKVEQLKEVQSKMIGDFHIIKLEKEIQEMGRLLVILDNLSGNDLFNELHDIDIINIEDLPNAYNDASFDSVKIAILRKLYGLKGGYNFEVHRNSSYFGMSPNGLAELSEDLGHLEIGGCRPGRIENYTLLHEFLHIYLIEQGLNIELDTDNEGHKNYFFYLKNLVNDLIIELLIIEKFGIDFSSISSDLGKYSSQNSLRNLNFENSMNIITRGLSNEINFENNTKLRKYFDTREFLQIFGIQKETITRILQRVKNWKNESYLDILGYVHTLLTGGELKLLENGKVEFNSIKEVDKFLFRFNN